MRHGQESPDGQEIGPSVHQDKEEHVGGVERGELWIILHDVVKQNCNLNMDSDQDGRYVISLVTCSMSTGSNVTRS